MSDLHIETAMAWGAVAGAGFTILTTGALGHTLGTLSVSVLLIIALTVEHYDTSERHND